METDLGLADRQRCNHLTAVKLALEMLARTTPLSDQQHPLVQRAIEGINALSADLLQRMDAERHQTVSREPLDRTVDASDIRWLLGQLRSRAATAQPLER
jgi:hypothetical protein